MNLRNVQSVQVANRSTGLGILGTRRIWSPADGSVTTHVQFILNTTYPMDDDSHFISNLQDLIKSEVLVAQSAHGCNILFTLTINDDLWNPQGFLRAIARKIVRIWVESERAEEAQMQIAEQEVEDDLE